MIGDDRDSRPVPDPTVLTTQGLLREIAHLRELMEARLLALTEKLQGEHALKEEKFRKVDQRFELIEVQRVEQKDDSQKGVEAALVAQKEAVAKLDEANQKAINKQEAAFSETLAKVAELSKTTTDALASKIEDAKERLSRIEASKAGAVESRIESRSAISSSTAIIGSVIAFL